MLLLAMVSHQPRPYQARALDELRENVKARIKRQLLVAPTGAGKTTIAALMIQGAVAKKKRIGFLAHRRELISQASKRLDGQGIDHGIIQANHWRTRPDLPVQVISVPTLTRRLHRKPPLDLIIIDEAHRSMAAGYQKIVDAYPEAVVIGLTATPWRLDGRPLGKFYQDLVLASKPSELIADGWLMQPRVFAPFVPDVSGLKTTRGDFDPRDLDALMNNAQLVGDVVHHWRILVHARGGSGLSVVFAVNVQHSRALAAKFCEAGVAAAHLDADTPAADRDRILVDMHEGRIQVVCNCMILTEGWDLPALNAVILARPTASVALFLQMVGRVMRPHPGKTEALVIDHAASTLRHGFAHTDREYVLTTQERKKKTKDEGPALTVCPECFTIFPSADLGCPTCGWVKPKPKQKIREAEGNLSELDPSKVSVKPWTQISQTDQVHAFAELKAKQRTRGFKDLWSCLQFKERLGFWPSKPVQAAGEARAERLIAERARPAGRVF